MRFEAELQRVKDDSTGDGVEHEVRQLVRGNEPAEDLIAVAKEVEADFIVIGLRRRTPVGKLILGSNAQRILLDAPARCWRSRLPPTPERTRCGPSLGPRRPSRSRLPGREVPRSTGRWTLR